MVLSAAIAFLFPYEPILWGTACAFVVGLVMFVTGLLTEGKVH